MSFLTPYIEKGEAKLIFSSANYTQRNEWIENEFLYHPDIVILKEEKMKIDTVRDFAYEMQKGSTEGMFGVNKLGILICDDIALAAQNSLLKILEDIDPNSCIIISAHTESVFIPTIKSRVIEGYHPNTLQSKYNIKELNLSGKTVAERLESVKKIMKDFDDEKITKQDIIGILDQVKEHKEVYSRAFSMLKQPSVSVKYVLEYIAATV